MSPIFVPFVGMLVLTLVVWLWMFRERIGAMQRLCIQIETKADLDRLGPRAINTAANFQNLFELPVVFYACVLAVFALGQVDTFYVVCAWGFFLFRIAHSGIHCTYNHIMQRFTVYAIASLFLWVMVIRLAVTVVRGVAA